MTIDYVNSEILWLQNNLQGHFQKMLAVEDDEMSQIGIPITLLHNKKIKRWYHSMLWDLILWIPLTKKMSPPE